MSALRNYGCFRLAAVIHKLKKEGMDILVQNGEIRIPRELVKIIGLKKLRAWNNTGLRARGESPIAA